MKRNVQKLFPQQSEGVGETSLALVADVAEGEARTLTLADGSLVTVVAHLNEIPLLKTGDRVLVHLLREGAVVAGRVRAPGEKPQPLVQRQDGRFVIEATAGIVLQAGEASVELTSDGRIRVDGREVYSIASGRMRLQGATIELN